jgi:hypothetical protein
MMLLEAAFVLSKSLIVLAPRAGCCVFAAAHGTIELDIAEAFPRPGGIGMTCELACRFREPL